MEKLSYLLWHEQPVLGKLSDDLWNIFPLLDSVPADDGAPSSDDLAFSANSSLRAIGKAIYNADWRLSNIARKVDYGSGHSNSNSRDQVIQIPKTFIRPFGSPYFTIASNFWATTVSSG